MLKKIAALLTRKPFFVPKEEIIEVVSLSELLKKPTLKKTTIRKPTTKKVVAKKATKVSKKTIKKKNAG